jgi:hypothetical protein
VPGYLDGSACSKQRGRRPTPPGCCCCQAAQPNILFRQRCKAGWLRSPQSVRASPPLAGMVGLVTAPVGHLKQVRVAAFHLQQGSDSGQVMPVADATPCSPTPRPAAVQPARGMQHNSAVPLPVVGVAGTGGDARCLQVYRLPGCDSDQVAVRVGGTGLAAGGVRRVGGAEVVGRAAAVSGGSLSGRVGGRQVCALDTDVGVPVVALAAAAAPAGGVRGGKSRPRAVGRAGQAAGAPCSRVAALCQPQPGFMRQCCSKQALALL